MLTTIKYNKGVQEIYPTHKMVNNWLFSENENSEAQLASAIAEVAEKNGMSTNDVAHIFPPILRMLKSNIDWSK